MAHSGILQMMWENFLLAALGPKNHAAFVPHTKIATLTHSLVLLEQDAAVSTVYFPVSGMISLLTPMDSGEAIELATIGSDGAIGFLEAVGRPQAFARAVVQVPGVALTIPAATLHQITNENDRLRELAACFEHALLAQLAQTAACNALHPLDRRLARWLLQTSDRMGKRSLLLTQDFVAQMLGVSRTTVTLLAGKLQQKGIIRYSRGHIEILDRARLEAASCECYHTINRRIDEAYEGFDIRRLPNRASAL